MCIRDSADLVQQVVEGDGLTGTLGHPDHLAVPQQLHQLHEHEDVYKRQALTITDISSA